jgi:hypothetical protein
VFTRVRHLSLFWARSTQSTPCQMISLRSILISSPHLRLHLPIGIFLSGFPTKILYALLHSSYVPHVPPNRLILCTRNLITRIFLGEEYKSRSSSLCSHCHSSNTFLSTIFLHTLSLFSSLDVRDQVLHPYKKY